MQMYWASDRGGCAGITRTLAKPIIYSSAHRSILSFFRIFFICLSNRILRGGPTFFSSSRVERSRSQKNSRSSGLFLVPPSSGSSPKSGASQFPLNRAHVLLPHVSREIQDSFFFLHAKGRVIMGIWPEISAYSGFCRSEGFHKAFSFWAVNGNMDKNADKRVIFFKSSIQKRFVFLAFIFILQENCIFDYSKNWRG